MTPRQRTAAWIETQIVSLKSMAMATRGAVDPDMENINAVCKDELIEYEKVKRIVLEPKQDTQTRNPPG